MPPNPPDVAPAERGSFRQVLSDDPQWDKVVTENLEDGGNPIKLSASLGACLEIACHLVSTRANYRQRLMTAAEKDGLMRGDDPILFEDSDEDPGEDEADPENVFFVRELFVNAAVNAGTAGYQSVATRLLNAKKRGDIVRAVDILIDDNPSLSPNVIAGLRNSTEEHYAAAESTEAHAELSADCKAQTFKAALVELAANKSDPDEMLPIYRAAWSSLACSPVTTSVAAALEYMAYLDGADGDDAAYTALCCDKLPEQGFGLIRLESKQHVSYATVRRRDAGVEVQIVDNLSERHEELDPKIVNEHIPGGAKHRYNCYPYGFRLTMDEFQVYVKTVRNMSELPAVSADKRIYAHREDMTLRNDVENIPRIVRAQRVENCVFHNLNAALSLGCGNKNNDADGKTWVRDVTLPISKFVIAAAQRRVVGLMDDFVRNQVEGFLISKNECADKWLANC